MIKKDKQLLFLRILLCVLIVCNMVVVFLFSAQNGTKSAAISEKITIAIIEILSRNDKEETTIDPDTIGQESTPPVLDSNTTAPPDITAPPETTTDVVDTTEPPTTESGSTDEGVTTPPEESTPAPEPEESSPDAEETTPAPPEETTPFEEITTEEDPYANLTEEQIAAVHQAHTPIRKLAHFLEFGTLGALVFLLLLSWRGRVWWRYAASLGFALIYAATDELHQLFRDGRGSQISDVCIDFAGAVFTCTLVLVFVVVVRYGNRLVTTHYNVPVTPNGKPLRIGLVTDLHACPHEGLVKRLRIESPDMILLAGDLMEDYELTNEDSTGYAFLRSCAEIAPTYYSFGNHETIGSGKQGKQCANGVPAEIRARIEKTGVTLLHNESVLANGIRICGLSSGLSKKENRPNEAAISEFASAKEFRILLCHHPEYYVPYIQKTNIELTVCGHAHGGQWRIFGRGVYAPGQGFFPKYTAGVIENRLVISRGAGDHTRIPRIANPRELVIVHCK